jgi:hypothetical protein
MAEVDLIATGQIQAGQSLSNEIDIGSKVLVGLVLPGVWIAAAGGISFQVSVDGGTTWNELTVGTTGVAFALAFTGAGAAYLTIDPTQLRGVQAIKVRSGTVGAPVVQTSLVTLTLVTRLVS